MSEFHFHRIFRIITGETPQQVLARARLGGSLPALASADGIAGATGDSAYASSQSYARALKSLTGATPSQLRDDPEQFALIANALKRPAGVADDAELMIEIAELAPLKLVAVRKTGDFRELNIGYYTLFDQVLAQIDPEHITGLYGIPHDDPRDTDLASCRFDCAITTSADVQATGDLTRIERGGGASLRLRIPGDYDRVHDALDALYRIAIALDLDLTDDLPLNFYHSDPEETAEEDLLADIHLMLAE